MLSFTGKKTFPRHGNSENAPGFFLDGSPLSQAVVTYAAGRQETEKKLISEIGLEREWRCAGWFRHPVDHVCCLPMPKPSRLPSKRVNASRL